MFSCLVWGNVAAAVALVGQEGGGGFVWSPTAQKSFEPCYHKQSVPIVGFNCNHCFGVAMVGGSRWFWIEVRIQKAVVKEPLIACCFQQYVINSSSVSEQDTQVVTAGLPFWRVFVIVHKIRSQSQALSKTSFAVTGSARRTLLED